MWVDKLRPRERSKNKMPHDESIQQVGVKHVVLRGMNVLTDQIVEREPLQSQCQLPIKI